MSIPALRNQHDSYGNALLGKRRGYSKSRTTAYTDHASRS